MRFRVGLRKLSASPLPFHYQYPLACWFLRCLNVGDPELADEVHASTGFKPYCFSNLLLSESRISGEGLEFTRAAVVLSSPDSTFLRAFAEGLLTQPGFELRRRRFVVEDVQVLPDPLLGSRARFRTLSPVYAKTAREAEPLVTAEGSGGAATLLDGKPPLREWDLYPSDGKFYENVHRNLVERFTDFHGRPPERDAFEIVDVKDVKPKRVQIGSGHQLTHRRCAHFSFTALGNPELLRFLHDAGLGEKQAMGFGCVEVTG